MIAIVAILAIAVAGGELIRRARQDDSALDAQIADECGPTVVSNGGDLQAA